jgi:hypothetical protein
MEQQTQIRPKTHYIFHHAFVCSTLLARCLNQIDAFISLKEPWILRRLADIKRVHAGTITRPHWREMYLTYVPLLAKEFATGDSVVIKATNVANNLIEDVVAFSPDQKILFLYSDLKSFLVSNLKKTSDTQQKMASLAAGFLADSDFSERYPALSDIGNLDLLQTCALIWLCNIYSLQKTAGEEGLPQLATLNMDDLLLDTTASLAAVSRHFEHDPSEEDIAQMTDESVLSTNAKDIRVSFGTKQKQWEAQEVYNKNKRAIKDTLQWAKPAIEELELNSFLQQYSLANDQ